MYFLFLMIFLIFFLADFVVRIDYTIHITEQLCAVYIIGMASGRLLLVKFWGSLKLHADLRLHGGGGTHNSCCLRVQKWAVKKRMATVCSESQVYGSKITSSTTGKSESAHKLKGPFWFSLLSSMQFECFKNMFKTPGGYGWLRWLSVWLLISASLMISGLCYKIEPYIGLCTGHGACLWFSLSLSLAFLSLSRRKEGRNRGRKKVSYSKLLIFKMTM